MAGLALPSLEPILPQNFSLSPSFPSFPLPCLFHLCLLNPTVGFQAFGNSSQFLSLYCQIIIIIDLLHQKVQLAFPPLNIHGYFEGATCWASPLPLHNSKSNLEGNGGEMLKPPLGFGYSNRTQPHWLQNWQFFQQTKSCQFNWQAWLPAT